MPFFQQLITQTLDIPYTELTRHILIGFAATRIPLSDASLMATDPVHLSTRPAEGYLAVSGPVACTPLEDRPHTGEQPEKDD